MGAPERPSIAYVGDGAWVLVTFFPSFLINASVSMNHYVCQHVLMYDRSLYLSVGFFVLLFFLTYIHWKRTKYCFLQKPDMIIVKNRIRSPNLAKKPGYQSDILFFKNRIRSFFKNRNLIGSKLRIRNRIGSKLRIWNRIGLKHRNRNRIGSKLSEPEPANIP